MRKLKHRFDMFTYTKKWTTIILIFCIIWICASYVLALFGEKETAEALGKGVFDLTKAIFCTYIVRAFFDTYSEKKNDYKMYCELMKNSEENQTPENTDLYDL